MIYYTSQEISEILENCDSRKDLHIVWQYIVENKYKYSLAEIDNIKFLVGILNSLYTN